MSGARANEELTACPDDIAVIGGGRWARTIIQVLCKLVPASAIVSVYSRHNASSMIAWSADQELTDRVRVVSEWPDFVSGKSGAAIIANAARDHEQAAIWTLSAGMPTLIEKPLALTATAAQRIADVARRNSVRLAAAHVFLFARYVERFVELVREAGPASALRMKWEDPAVESRNGELKRYDASLPVPADVLPHLISILRAMVPGSAIECGPVVVRRGGAQVELDLVVGGLPCAVQLIRKGEKRCRSVEITTEQGTISLDFSREPGTIVHGDRIENGDPDWETAKRPLARLLTTFLGWAAGGNGDDRLDPTIGVEACCIVDQVLEKYWLAQSSWLDARTAPGNNVAVDELAYALRELNLLR